MKNSKPIDVVVAGKPISEGTIFREVVARGIEYDHHGSDLYIPRTEETCQLVLAFRLRSSTFKSNIDLSLWMDIPFQYDPHWENVARKVESR